MWQGPVVATLRALAAQLFQAESNRLEIVCGGDAVHRFFITQNEA